MNQETSRRRSGTPAHALSRRHVVKAGVGGAVAALAGALPRPAIAQARPLRFWTWLDPGDSNPRAQVQTRLIERFTENTGIEVTVEVVDWRTLPQQLLRAVAAGEGPDVTRIYSAGLPEQVAAGTLAPLDPMMEAQWSSADRDDVGPPLPQFDGRTMAMYIENRIYMLYYREDYLEEAGLPVPGTFDAVAAAVEALSNSHRSGLIWPASIRSTDTFSYASPMIWAMGGNLVHEDKTAAFHEGGAVEFYTWLRDLIHVHNAMPPSMVSVDEEVLQQAVNSGTCAMAFMGTNRLGATRSRLAADDPSVLKATHAPSLDGTPPPVPVGGWCLGVTTNSEQPEEAFALIHGLTDTEAQILNAREAGEMPVRRSALDDPWFGQDEAAEMRSWIEYIAAHGRDDPSQKLVRSREFNRLLNTATQEIVLEDRPVAEALDAAAAEWNAIRA